MNQTLLEPNVPIDLSNCDLEPIHIPSSIQPHGMLLAARSSDLRIVYVSDNVEAFLRVTPSRVLERTLPEILGSDAVDAIEHALGKDSYAPKDIRTFTFPLCGDRPFDVTAHRTQGLLCLEVELSQGEKNWDLLSSRMEGAMRTLGLAKTLTALCAATAPVLRALTGYDRVMVYKFDADGHGEVVAEDKAPELEPLLGLHYPATDIPTQARMLYLKQRFRTIVDVNYVPVPLIGNRSLIDSTPLDMTYCGLRSVSPIHIEYLQNMGVAANLSISLIVGGELWGMIIGHHRTPRNLAPESRALCDLLGQLVSLLFGVTQQSDEGMEERKKKVLLDRLAKCIESGTELEQSLLDSKGALLALVGADGAIFRIGDRLSLIGKTPVSEEASALLAAFESNIRGGTASSNEIGAIFPAFSHLAKLASGGLMVPMGGRGNGILWLRSEMAATVRWAGKPDASKHVFEGSFRLSPRKSFAVWEQTQHGLSIPWSAIEIEAALSLDRVAARALLVQLRSRTENQLKKTQARLSAIFNGSLDGVVVFEAIRDQTGGLRDLRFVMINRAAETLMRVDAATLIGKGLLESFPNTARDGLFDRLSRTIHNDVSFDEEYLSHREEAPHWYRTAGVKLGDGIVLSYTEITERKHSEDQLRTALRRLGLATDALNAGIWDWDIRSGDLSWDERMFEIYAIPTSTAVDYKLWASLVQPEDFPSAEAMLQHLIASKSQGSFDFRIRLPDGSIRYIQAAAGAILDDVGQVIRVIGINIDTTGRKFNEDLERQVSERTAQLKAANIELEEFAYVASHDLKAPLRVIENASKWLEEDLAEHLTVETRDTMKLLRGRVQRMDKLLDDLLEYARIGRTSDGPLGAAVAGDDLVNDVLALLPVGNFKISVSSGFSEIRVSRMPLQQILSNLIGNAIKHSDRTEGCIELTVKDVGEFYEFAVHDDGPGIPVQFHAQIFKMFQTLRPRDQVEGSGMGLAMARKTVELSGGVLTVESTLGRGSTFRFTWPKEQRIERGERSSEILNNA